MAATPQPPARPWKGERGDLTLLHMNILAQSLTVKTRGDLTSAPGTAFPSVPEPEIVFDPRRRMLLILGVLLEHSPDVLCLAEVDANQYVELVRSLPGDYRGIHMRKSGVQTTDGTAIFYRTHRVKCLNVQNAHLNPRGSQVAVCVHFRTRFGNKRTFIVAACHLKAKPGFEHERLKQCKIVMDLVNQTRATSHYASPVFLLGDLNDTPGSLCIDYIEAHPTCFESAYGQFYSHGGVDDYYTTFKKREEEVCRIIDYIFYQPVKCKCTGVVAIPPKSTFPNRLPAPNYPSDHLALVAGFVFE